MKKILLLLFFVLTAVYFVLPGGVAPSTTTTVNIKDEFFKAVKRGDTAFVKEKLDSKQVIINSQDTDGRSAIIIAVDNVDVNMVLLLVTYRPDVVNVKDNKGRSALDAAAEKGNMQITQALNALK
ncbi:MAG: ankyrin repeat domain-containing protein [Spirochaetes bacterium]|nr:ankyrin repeat domain-containing protein [Spirochaetota bacterium]